jgi:hypothetical protein
VETRIFHAPVTVFSIDGSRLEACVANRAVQTGQTKFVLFETLYLWAFQRCRTRSEQLKSCICNTSAKEAERELRNASKEFREG